MFTHLQRLCHSPAILGAKKVVLVQSRLINVENPNIETKCEEINIPVPWGNLSGRWWGSTAEQPILAVHGWEDNAGSYDELAPLLNTSLLAIDLPGHGLSSHYLLGTTYNFMDGVTLIRQIVRHFKWNDITIIGHSYGSMLAFAYSAFFPKNVKNLIGIECVRAVITQKTDSVAEDLRSAIDTALYMEERMARNPPSYSMNEMMDLLQNGSKGPISKKCCEVLLKRGAKEIGEEKYSFSRDPRLKTLPLGRMTDDLLFACSSRITCNVLHILANPGWNVARSDAYAETVKLMRQSAMRYEERVVEGTHHVHLDNPQRVASVIKQFLSLS